MASIGKHAVCTDHLYGGDGTSTQGHGEVGRVLVCIEPKLCHPVLGTLRPNGLKYADGHHVFRFRQCGSNRHGAFKLSVVVFGLPWLAAGLPCAEKQWTVVHDGTRCDAFFQRGGIHKWLEA